jgi:hypothetical protein
VTEFLKIRERRPVTALAPAVTVTYAGRRSGADGRPRSALYGWWESLTSLDGRAVAVIAEPRIVPNELVRQARLRQASPSAPGQPMSRQELADSVNTLMTGSESGGLDAAHIGKLERGDYRWPNQRYREALRIALRAASDADLGFAPPRRP